MQNQLTADCKAAVFDVWTHQDKTTNTHTHGSLLHTQGPCSQHILHLHSNCLNHFTKIVRSVNHEPESLTHSHRYIRSNQGGGGIVRDMPSIERFFSFLNACWFLLLFLHNMTHKVARQIGTVLQQQHDWFGLSTSLTLVPKTLMNDLMQGDVSAQHSAVVEWLTRARPQIFIVHSRSKWPAPHPRHKHVFGKLFSMLQLYNQVLWSLSNWLTTNIHSSLSSG